MRNVVVTILVAMACATPLAAVTTVWKGPTGGGLFQDPANWTNVVPGTGVDDLAIFNATTNVDGPITFNSQVSIGDIYFQNTTGRLEMDIGDYQLLMSDKAILGTAAGQVNDVVVSSGQVQSAFIFIGNAAGSEGNSLTLSGSDTHWTTTATTASIRVGSNGGSYSALTIADGASLESQTQMIIALQGAAHNLVTVTGNGSQLSVAQSLSIGDNTSAGLPAQTDNQLQVLDGGFVTVRELIIGTTEYSPNSTVLVSGAGSRLNVRGGQQSSPSSSVGQQNDVGRASANNRLMVENHGVIDGGAIFYLGRYESSTDNLLSVTSGGSLTGTGVRINNGTLLIDQGAVTLNRIYDTQRVPPIVLGGVFRIDQPDAHVDFRSGTLTTPSAIVTNGQQFVIGDGSATPAMYRMTPDTFGSLPRGPGADTLTHTFADGLHLSSNAVLTGSGDIIANVTGVTGAHVKVGDEFGIIRVTGAWNNRRITVELQIGDLTQTQTAGVNYDLLDITGNFVHGSGSAIIIDTSLFQPAASETTFRVIGWTGQVSADVGSVLTFTGGPTMAYEFRSDGLYLTAPVALHPGDANGDGLVNLADLQILGDNWQSITATWAEADFNGDNLVNLADLQIIGDNWNFGVNTDMAFKQALEQTSLALPELGNMTWLALLLLLSNRRHGNNISED
ncbi:MAG: hypothetical protein IT445_10275 [Phycisphaeraceae bacterium]|nr:hypothetical protein [Phycisphaeraceae bacterium]